MEDQLQAALEIIDDLERTAANGNMAEQIIAALQWRPSGEKRPLQERRWGYWSEAALEINLWTLLFLWLADSDEGKEARAHIVRVAETWRKIPIEPDEPRISKASFG